MPAKVHTPEFAGVFGRRDSWGFGSTSNLWIWREISPYSYITSTPTSGISYPEFHGVRAACVVRTYYPSLEWGGDGQYWTLPDGRLLVAAHTPLESRKRDIWEYPAAEAEAALAEHVRATLMRHPWTWDLPQSARVKAEKAGFFSASESPRT